MADPPIPELVYEIDGCPDCAKRRVVRLPPPLDVEDDFDGGARDFLSIRDYLLSELAADTPERQSWQSADVETMLVELLAARLDVACAAIDTAHAEHFLPTARWPRSVVRLLALVDGVNDALGALRPHISPRDIEALGLFSPAQSDAEALYHVLSHRPQLIPLAKSAGLSQIHYIITTVTLGDLEHRMRRIGLIAQVDLAYRPEAAAQLYEAVIILAHSHLRLFDLVEEIPSGRDGFITAIMRSMMTCCHHRAPWGQRPKSHTQRRGNPRNDHRRRDLASDRARPAPFAPIGAA